MAARYWVGSSNTWNTTASTKWASTSGGASGASAPTAADDAFFDANSTGTITLATGATARSIDCTGFTGTISHPSSTSIPLGDATAGASNIALKFVAGMTYTGNSTGNWLFQSTSTTQQSIDFASKTGIGSVTINGAGSSYIMQGDMTQNSNAANFTLTTGTLNTNGFAMSWSTFKSAGTSAQPKVINLGSSTITLLGTSGTVLDLTVGSTGVTLNPGTSTIKNNVANVAFQLGSFTYYNLDVTTTTVTLNGSNPTFNKVICNPAAGIGALIICNTGFTATDLQLTCTDSGTSGGRGWFTSGTQPANNTHTFTIANAPTLSNFDFTDTIAAGTGGTWAGTNLGDGLGNSGITFPASRTLYWVGAAGTYSTLSRWATSSGGAGGNHPPMAHDDVVFDANSGITVGGTLGVSRILGRSIDMSAANATFTWSMGLSPSAFFGNLALKTGMTVSGAGQLQCNGRGAHTLTTNGVAIGLTSTTGTLSFACPGGSYTLQDDVTISATNGQFQLAVGTLNTNDKTINAGTFASNSGNTRTINLGSSTLNLNGTGAVWNCATVNGLTLNGSNATINVTDTSSTNKTFEHRTGGTLGTVNFTGGGTGAVVFGGGASQTVTYGTLNLGAPKTYTFNVSTGLTLAVTNFIATGSVGNIITLNSATPGTQAKLSKASGVVNADYLSVQDINAIGGATWYAGHNSTDVSNNTGWIFASYFTASGSISGDSTVTSDNLNKVLMSGSFSGDSVVSSGSLVKILMVATPSGDSTITASDLLKVLMAASASGDSTIAASILTFVTAAGSISGDSTIVGAVTRKVLLASAISGDATATASQPGLRVLTGGSVSGDSQTTAALAALRIYFSGSVQGDSQIDAANLYRYLENMYPTVQRTSGSFSTKSRDNVGAYTPLDRV